MKSNIISKFKGKINEVMFENEQSYYYLEEFIIEIEKKYKLNIENKQVTELIQSQLYEETEKLFNNNYDDYDSAHSNAMDILLDDSNFICSILKYSKNIINI